MSAGWKYIDSNGRQQVHLGQIGRAEAKRLRQLARGSRGTGRGRGEEPAVQPAEDEREASSPRASIKNGAPAFDSVFLITARLTLRPCLPKFPRRAMGGALIAWISAGTKRQVTADLCSDPADRQDHRVFDARIDATP